MVPMPTKSPPSVTFANGTVAHLDTSRIADSRKRGFRAVYADGVVEIDFLTREIVNTTPRPLAELEMGDPLGDAVSAFVAAARGEAAPLVLPEQAARALETALLIEEAADATIPAVARARYGRLAATALTGTFSFRRQHALNSGHDRPLPHRLGAAQSRDGRHRGQSEARPRRPRPGAATRTSSCSPNSSSSAIRPRIWC